MKFGISGPGCQCLMEHSAFNAYAIRQQQIEDFINMLATAKNPNDYDSQWAAALCANLNMSSLSDDEINYIEREVSRRCQ